MFTTLGQWKTIANHLPIFQSPSYWMLIHPKNSINQLYGISMKFPFKCDEISLKIQVKFSSITIFPLFSMHLRNRRTSNISVSRLRLFTGDSMGTRPSQPSQAWESVWKFITKPPKKIWMLDMNGYYEYQLIWMDNYEWLMGYEWIL